MAEAREAGAAAVETFLRVCPRERTTSAPRAIGIRAGGWGLFNFSPQDADALRAMLQADEMSLAGVECDIPGRIEWWPVLLRGTVNAEHAKAAGLQAYRSRQGRSDVRRELESGPGVLLGREGILSAER